MSTSFPAAGFSEQLLLLSLGLLLSCFAFFSLSLLFRLTSGVLAQRGLYWSQIPSIFRAVKRLHGQEDPESSERRCSALAVRKCWNQSTKLVCCFKEFLLEHVRLTCPSKISVWMTQMLHIVIAFRLYFSLKNSIMEGLMVESWRGFSTYQQVSNLVYWVFSVLGI